MPRGESLDPVDASTAAGLLIVRSLPGTPIRADAAGHALQLGEILDPVGHGHASAPRAQGTPIGSETRGHALQLGEILDQVNTATAAGLLSGADAAGHALQAPVCRGASAPR